MLNHYESVWKAMGRAKFAIIFTEHFYNDKNGNKKPGVSSFLRRIKKEKYTVYDIKNIINCGLIFDYVITNHPISGNSKKNNDGTKIDIFKKIINRLMISCGGKPRWNYNVDIETYLPLQIGKKQIRYMYGADLSDSWSLMDWNEIYDIFLCHGVNDENIIKERFQGETFIMGYPRYDNYFNGTIDLSSIKEEFNISEEKKTLLWMPTLGGEGSSIPIYAKSISELKKYFNIIVRPHPLSFEQEKDFIDEIKKYNLNLDSNPTRNMNGIFSLADLVVADYGGTPFSAIFLGKNLIFLDVPGADSIPINANSTVLELKKHLPVLKEKDLVDLPKLLSSQCFLDKNKTKIDFLFLKYFGTTRGGGSARVAKYLKTL